jgi:hypothetical protein
MKTYNNASNARRAAKAANLTGFTIIKDDTGYTIQVAAAPAPEPEPAPKAAKAPKAKTRKAKPAAKVSIAKKAPKVAARKAPAPSTRPGTKGAQLIAMCTRGATHQRANGNARLVAPYPPRRDLPPWHGWLRRHAHESRQRR